MPRNIYIALVLLVLVTPLAVAGCGPIKTEASYPTRQSGSDKIVYTDQKRETVWGDGPTLGDRLLGRESEDKSQGGGIGVNSFLWRAALDTVSFMPVTTTDPFGGTILTDWYENPDQPGERFKLNVYILDKSLRADALKVSVFKQKKDKSGWRDIKVPDSMATDLENSILARARELRVAQMGRNLN